MTAWEQAYELFAEESKAQVSLEQYTSAQQGPLIAITDYAFPSVEVDGDSATVERILTTSEEENGESQNKATQQLVREDGQWKVVMRDDQITYYTSAPETTG